MRKLRLVFEKRDRAKYISHLDLNRCMQRAIKRAKLPIAYTEGFNPHPYLVFPLALSLGFESCCEVLDFGVEDMELSLTDVLTRLNGALPTGLQILRIGEPQRKAAEIGAAEYAVALTGTDPAALTAALEAFLGQDAILAEKRNKKKEIIEVDLKPSLRVCSLRETADGVMLVLQLPAGSQTNLNPSLLLEAFSAAGTAAFTVGKIERIKIICADGKEFS